MNNTVTVDARMGIQELIMSEIEEVFGSGSLGEAVLVGAGAGAFVGALAGGPPGSAVGALVGGAAGALLYYV